MKFIDEVKITIGSGHGGAGACSFRREKHVPFGGPDGGDGGHGGSVYFEADTGINTLVHFRGKKVFRAPDGGKGLGRNMNGADGEDLVLRVPVGTLVRDTKTGEVLADLTEHGQRVLMAKGGRGGWGNMNFKSSTNQAPRHQQDG